MYQRTPYGVHATNGEAEHLTLRQPSMFAQAQFLTRLTSRGWEYNENETQRMYDDDPASYCEIWEKRDPTVDSGWRQIVASYSARTGYEIVLLQ